MIPPQPALNLDGVVDQITGALSRSGRAPAAGAGQASLDDGGRVGPVLVQAVSKYMTDGQVAELVAAGIRCLGENRDEKLATRRSSLAAPAGLEWHFVGRLQSRKVPRIVGAADCVETLCTQSAAGRLDAAARAGAQLPRVFVQVNVDADPAKDGVPAASLDAFLNELPATVVVDGLMTMPAAAPTPAASRPAFHTLRELSERCRAGWQGRHTLTELSMGTSQDFAVAVEEGATVVRLGRVLYRRRE